MSTENGLFKQLPGGCNGWWAWPDLTAKQQAQARELWPQHAGERSYEDYRYAVSNFNGEVRARQLQEYLR